MSNSQQFEADPKSGWLRLGIMAHELQPVMPTAVGVLPERRWTNPKGVTNQTKNVPASEFPQFFLTNTWLKMA